MLRAPLSIVGVVAWESGFGLEKSQLASECSTVSTSVSVCSILAVRLQ